MTEALCILFAAIGAFFMLVAGLGVLRMPDLYMRMSASSKASTLGVSFALLAAMFYFRDLAVTSRCVATIIFMFMTTPVAAHMIARAGYLSGARLWKGTIIDQLQGQYDLPRKVLQSEGIESGTDEIAERALSGPSETQSGSKSTNTTLD